MFEFIGRSEYGRHLKTSKFHPGIAEVSGRLSGGKGDLPSSVEICHLPFSKLCEKFDDLRQLVPELKDYPHPIRFDDVVVDSDMKLHEAFRGLAKDCPAEIVAQQYLMRVLYFGTDHRLHHGQVVIHEALVNDVAEAFRALLRERVPIGSVIPISDSRFEKGGAMG